MTFVSNGRNTTLHTVIGPIFTIGREYDHEVSNIYSSRGLQSEDYWAIEASTLEIICGVLSIK